MVQEVATFSEFSAHDRSVSEWFTDGGRPVTSRSINPDNDVYTWRHEAGTVVRQLRVKLEVLQDLSATSLVDLLRCSDAAAMLGTADCKYVLVQRGAHGMEVVARHAMQQAAR